MKANTLIKALRFCFLHNFPVLVVGPPGGGKTDIITQVAAELQYDLLITHPTVSDPTDFKGMPYAGADAHATFLPFGDLERLIGAEKPLIFFADDIGQATPAVQAAYMQLPLGGRIGQHKVNTNFVRFVAATNRRGDKAAVTGMLEPLKSRFVILDLETDLEGWTEWAMTATMPPELIAFMQFRPELLHKFEPSAEIRNGCCPRTIAKAGSMQKQGIPPGLELDLFRGCAGEGFAIEYTSFLDTYRNLPDVDRMLRSPHDATIPSEPSILYALSGAIAHRATPANMDMVVALLSRLPAEISVLTMKMLVKRDVGVCKTSAFSQWAKANKDVMQ